MAGPHPSAEPVGRARPLLGSAILAPHRGRRSALHSVPAGDAGARLRAHGADLAGRPRPSRHGELRRHPVASSALRGGPVERRSGPDRERSASDHRPPPRARPTSGAPPPHRPERLLSSDHSTRAAVRHPALPACHARGRSRSERVRAVESPERRRVDHRQLRGRPRGPPRPAARYRRTLLGDPLRAGCARPLPVAPRVRSPDTAAARTAGARQGLRPGRCTHSPTLFDTTRPLA